MNRSMLITYLTLIVSCSIITGMAIVGPSLASQIIFRSFDGYLVRSIIGLIAGFGVGFYTTRFARDIEATIYIYRAHKGAPK